MVQLKPPKTPPPPPGPQAGTRSVARPRADVLQGPYRRLHHPPQPLPCQRQGTIHTPPPTLARKINSSSSFPCTPNPGFFLSSMAPLPLGGEVGPGQTPSPKGPPTGRVGGPSADPCNRCGYSPNRWLRICEPGEYISYVFLPPTLATPPPPALLWSNMSAAPGRCLPAGELRGPAEPGVRLRPLAARPPRARRPRPLRMASTQRPHRCAFGGGEGSGRPRGTFLGMGDPVSQWTGCSAAPTQRAHICGGQSVSSQWMWGQRAAEGGGGSCPQRARVRVPVPPDGHAAGGRPRRPPRPAPPALRGVGPVSVRTVEPGGGVESPECRNSDFFQALEYIFLQREPTFVPTRIQYTEPNSSATSTYKPASQDCGRTRSVTQVFGHWLVQRSFGFCTRRTPSA